MNDMLQIIIGVAALTGVYLLARKFQVWKVRRTYALILKDLKQRGAMDSSSAVKLPYLKASILRMGVRDYRPMAMEHLVSNGIVAVTAEGAYYVKDHATSERVIEAGGK
jgi:hypothetical protein